MPKLRPRHHARHARPRRKAYARRLDAQLIQQAEVNALRFGIGANLLMAIAGWLGYYFSGSSALSFDGNYALISAISCGVAIRIARHKDVRNDDYPYGHYSFESLYAFIKGLTLLAIILYALMESGVAIARYMNGVRERELQTLPILVYMGVTFVMCMGVYAYYAWQYRRTGSSSTILQVEASEALMDTLLSLGMGMALLAIALVPAGGNLDFLRWLGDPFIVILMSLAMLKMPLGIVRTSFYSLVGRTLRARPLRSRLERLVRRHLDGQFKLEKVHALKIGSCYEITVTLRPVQDDAITLPSYRQMRERMREALQKIFPNLILEILID